MEDLAKVLVMSNETWVSVKDRIFEKARHHADPIAYLDILKGIDIMIDNKLPFNAIEVYYKHVYEEILKRENKIDEREL